MCQCDDGQRDLSQPAPTNQNRSHAGNSTSSSDISDRAWLVPCKNVSVRHWHNPFKIGDKKFRSIWKRSLWMKSERLKVVVVQTSGPGLYTPLLETSASINRRYAALRGFDYLSVVGTISSAIDPLLSNHSFSAFNKVFLLNALVLDGRYDVAFYLDADALVFNFSFSPLQALNSSQLFAVCRGSSDEEDTWDVNDGVMIWNLKHARAREFSQSGMA